MALSVMQLRNVGLVAMFPVTLQEISLVQR